MWWLPPPGRAIEVSETYIDALVGREGEPVRVDEVAAGDRHLAARPVDAVDEAAVLLGVGLVALGVVEDPVRRIGEPDRAVGGDDDVVRRVEPPAPEPVDDRRARAVALVARDPAQAVLAGEDRAVVVERVAVGEVRRLEEDADRRRRPTSGGRRCSGRRSTGRRPRRGGRRGPRPRWRRRRAGVIGVPSGTRRSKRGSKATRVTGTDTPSRSLIGRPPRLGGAGVPSAASSRCSARWSPRSSAVLSRTRIRTAADGAPVIAIASPPTMIVRWRTMSRPYGALICALTLVRRYSPRPM